MHVASSGLENAKTISDIVSASVTALAVVVGGTWAYFKFAKGRTFRPRVSVKPTATWKTLDGETLLHVNVTLQNIGASVMNLIQRGSGLRVSALDEHQRTPPTTVSWRDVGMFDIFLEHAWIEPNEAVTDTRLLNIGLDDPSAVRLEVRIVLKRARGANIEVRACEILLRQSPVAADPLDSHKEA